MIQDIKKKKLWIPLLLTVVAAVLLRLLPARALAVHGSYYLLLFLFFVFLFDPRLSVPRYFREWKRLREFWLPVLLTLAGLTAIYFLREFLLKLPEHYIGDGLIPHYINQPLDYWVYGVTFGFLMPVAGGLFFRNTYIIHKENKQITYMYVLLFALMECLLYVEQPIGIVSALLPFIPLIISLLLTRNPRIPITAHILFNAYDKLFLVLYSIVRAAAEAETY
ncbi:MAG: hypothetical protein IK016_01380 [Lachnospiraceae bacterium]|nr:hypothetical protein [Lachnospiraceae bacterium]